MRLERQRKGNNNAVRDTSSSSSDDDELGGGLPGESRINSTRILMNNHETGQRRVPQFESSRKKSFIAGASRPESAISRPNLTDTLSDEDTLSLVSSIGSNSTLSSLSPKKQVAAMGRGGAHLLNLLYCHRSAPSPSAVPAGAPHDCEDMKRTRHRH